MVVAGVRGNVYEARVEMDREKTDLFLAVLDDKRVHFIGERPSHARWMFPVRSEMQRDLGTVDIPNDRDTLKDLVAGDNLRVHYSNGKSYSAKILEKPQEYMGG